MFREIRPRHPHPASPINKGEEKDRKTRMVPAYLPLPSVGEGGSFARDGHLEIGDARHMLCLSVRKNNNQSPPPNLPHQQGGGERLKDARSPPIPLASPQREGRKRSKERAVAACLPLPLVGEGGVRGRRKAEGRAVAACPLSQTRTEGCV